MSNDSIKEHFRQFLVFEDNCRICKKANMNKHFHMTDYFGRLGNQLMCLSNGLFLALKYSGKFTLGKPIVGNLESCGLVLIDPFEIEFGPSGGGKSSNLKGTYWNVWEDFDVTVEEVEYNRPHILRTFVLPRINMPELYAPINSHEDIDLSSYDVVVHLRGGDKFLLDGKRHVVTGGDVQCPLSYFVKIFEDHNFRNILLVAEDKINPVVNKLLDLKKYNIVFQSSSIPFDVNTILNAKKFIIGGHTSFARTLMQMSTKVEEIFVPYIDGMDDFPHWPWFNFDSPEHKPKIHKLYHKNYMSWFGENGWANTDEQWDLMLNYDNKNIKYIDSMEEIK